MKKKLLRIVLGITFLLNMFFLTTDTLASTETKSSDKTEVGVQFSKDSKKGDDKDSVPDISKPIIDHGKTLPVTGELAQPVIFMLLGWLLIILIVYMYKITKREEEI